MRKAGTKKAKECNPFRECRGMRQSVEQTGGEGQRVMFHTAKGGSE